MIVDDRDRFGEIFDRVERMQTVYGFSSSDWEPIEKALSDLRLRHEDKNLYLGVIGEFSCGKSTLINALLGVEALKEDVLQGTTCAPTLLRQGTNFDVEVLMASGAATKYSTSDNAKNREGCDFQRGELSDMLCQAREFIDKFTADEEHSKDVKFVTIYLPLKNSLFANNIVIVDTPGINADNPRHQEVTEKAIREICDTAIVLTRATTPCSLTLVDFVKNHLVGLTENCLCIASQIDLIRRRERARQLAFIEQKFLTEGAKFQKVIGLSAYLSEHPEERVNDSEAQLLRDEFKKAEHYIADVLRRNRKIVIETKLKQIISEVLINKVRPLLKDKTIELQDRHDKLLKNKLYDFDSYIQWAKCGYSKMLQIETIESEVERDIEELSNDIKNELFESVSACDSKDKVSSFFTHQIHTVFEATQNEKIPLSIEALLKRHVNQAESLLKGFRSDFNVAFRELAGKREEKIAIQEPSKKFKEDFKVPISTVTLKTLTDDENLQFGGVAGCAVIGFLVGGPLGALVGGMLGRWGMGIFGPSLSEVKNEAYVEVEKIVRDWKASITKAVISYVRGNATKVAESFIKEIDSYSQYREYVLAIISNERAEQEELKALISHASDDLVFLENAANLS